MKESGTLRMRGKEEEKKVNHFVTKSQLLSLFTAVKMNNFVQTAFFFPKYQARKILQKQL